MFTLFKRNVLVDNDCVARLGGLGSAFSLSLPTSWFAPTAERLFCGIAPELIHPHAFGFVHARTTKATDVFAFGMLAWEVSQFFACPSVSRYSLVGAGSSSLPGDPRSPGRSKLRWCSRCLRTTDHFGLITLKFLMMCGPRSRGAGTGILSRD